MGFPRTLKEMKEYGYKFSGDATCKGCQEDIEFWETPRGKKIPMDPMPMENSAAIAHWTTCENAPLFRDDKKGGR